MTEPKTDSIPKFASFRPKPALPPTSEVEDSKTSNRKSGDDRTHKRHHHSRQRSRSKERLRAHLAESRLSHGLQLDTPQQAIFVVDRKGDEKNLVYGSIHRYSAPPFHRFGAGHVLGAPSYLKIDRVYGDEKGLVLFDWKHSKSTSREKYIFSKVERDRPRLLKVLPEVKAPSIETVASDFIPLKASRGKKRKRRQIGDEENSGSGLDDEDYRSIHGKVKINDNPPDDGLEWATESESSGSDSGRTMKMDAGARQRNIVLSQRVEQSPHDVEAWLALIDHQDVMILGGDDRHRITNAELKSTADIKISMYEKALSHTTSLSDKERLLLSMMTEGAKFWDTKTQSDKWEQISKDNINSIKLWTSYLNFKQTTFSTFLYEDIKEIFVARIQLLSQVIDLDHDSVNVDELYNQLIYVLLRLTNFVRESGYSELAEAIWQSLLEVNFSSPRQQLSKIDTTKLFSDFWESEVPRIGEDGSLGWWHFVENQEAIDIPDALVDIPVEGLTISNIFQSWASAERLASKSSSPARTMDEVVEDDPFRVILFSDIERFLLQLPPNSVNLRKSLINAFLAFCRLPPLATFDLPESEDLDTDAFVRDELLESDAEWINHVYLSVPNTTEEAGTSPTLETIIKRYPISSETMFGLGTWLRLGNWKELYMENGGPLSYNFVRNSVKQLAQTYFDEDLAEYYLAFEAKNEPNSIKKVAKNLLKQHPASLRLYNAYAMIEWSRGNKNIAQGVFSAALSISEGNDLKPKKPATSDSIFLWRSWIWLCLEDGDNISALQHLLSIVDNVPDSSITPSATLLLKAQQYLSSNRDFYITSGGIRHAAIYAECLALLEYFTSTAGKESSSNHQGDISSALLVYTSFSQTLKIRGYELSSIHELFLQSAAHILYRHARLGAYRPALLREYLTTFLHIFPRNTIFLSLYDWNEYRVRIDNRVRNILNSTILTTNNDCITSRLFAIRYEIKHGTIHSAKAAFEHAVSSPACKSSAGLWKLYILYCAQTKQFQVQAKDVWYRAIRACPWAKELYVVGFEELRDLVEFKELKRTWRVMGEKDLRVHVDLEDKFEDIEELGKEVGKRRG